MKIKNIQTLFESYFKLEKITLEHNNKDIFRERLFKKSAVASLVYNTTTKNFIFVSQFRPGIMDDIIEIPAGTLDIPNEDKKNCMIREIKEEIGYNVDTIIELIPEFYISPGYTNEKITIYYCEVSEKINNGGGCDSEDENITVIEFTMSDMVKYNFIDAKTIMAINTYFNYGN